MYKAENSSKLLFFRNSFIDLHTSFYKVICRLEHILNYMYTIFLFVKHLNCLLKNNIEH